MPVSEAKRRGIPKAVGEEFVGKDGAPMAAGTIYVAPDGDTLLLRRSSAEKNFAGHWALPGGGADEGETPEQTAEREAREEMGDDVPTGARKLLDRRISPTGIVFHTFAQPVETKFAPKLNEEHTGYCWAALDQLPAPLHPAVKKTLSERLDIGEDMTPEDWEGLRSGFAKWVREEEREPERASAQDMALDRASIREIDKDGHLHVSLTNISKANVCPYGGAEIPDWENLGLDQKRIYRLYRDAKELEKAAATVDGKPLLFEHKPTSADDHQTDITVGAVMNPVWQAPYLKAELVVWPGDAIKAIQDGSQKELSCGYRYRADMTPGSANGGSYDGVMRDIIFNHVALVAEGRAGPDVVVGDSMENLMTTKVRLTRAGAAAYGALCVHLRPKMAADKKIGMAPAFVGVTAKNFKEKLPSIKSAMDGALKGKFANDAEAGEIIKAAGKMLDLFDPTQEEGMDDDLDAGTMDNKWGEDDESELQAMMERKKKASGAAQDEGETEEEKKEREAKEKAALDNEAGGAEAKVTKSAMDAALAKMAKDNAAKVKAAEDATIARMNDIAAAREAVDPLIGKVAIAVDSAEAIYDAAIKASGMTADGVNLAGKKQMVAMLVAQKSAANRPAPSLAHDSATTGELDAYRKQHGLTARAVKRV